jgi:hypothetical protein
MSSIPLVDGGLRRNGADVVNYQESCAAFLSKLEHFPSKWKPVGRKKMRKNNKLERTA